MNTFHITIATVGRLPITRGELQLRDAVRALISVCRGRRLLLFCFVDDHLHCVVRCQRPGYLARSIAGALRRTLPRLELQPHHIVDVASRAHLQRLVSYLVRQPSKHDLAGVHPALWTGSCFLDLVGARHLPGYEVSLLRAELPRFRLRATLAEVGLEPRKIGPCSWEELRVAGPARIIGLAASVHALEPRLQGATRPHTVARALALQTAKGAGFLPSHVADLLGLTERAARRLAKRPPDPKALAALRRRLTLEDRVRARSWRAA